MKEIFEKRDDNRVTRDRFKLNLDIPTRNQVTFCTKSLKFFGPKIWNAYQLISKRQKRNAFKDML